MILGLAAETQEVIPELAGGPGSHPAPQAPPKQTLTTKQAKAAADKLKAQQAKLAEQASAQDAEQARLAKQAADLKAQQVKLDARAAQLAAEEKRLTQLRADQATDHAAKLAEITRQQKAIDQQTAALNAATNAGLKSKPITPSEPALQTKPQTQMAEASPSPRPTTRLESRQPDANAGTAIDITKPAPIKPPAEKSEAAETHASSDRPAAQERLPDRTPDKPAFADRDDRDAPPDAPRALTAKLDLDAARQSCARAGENAALARRYYSARYDDAVRVYQDRGWKLRGHMRLEGRRGDLLIDTICDVDADGEAQHFAFVRGSAEAD